MATNPSTCLSTILLGLMILRIAPPSGGVPSEEMDRALSALRSRGRSLFANAITSSDLLFDLLSADSVTLVSPTDSMLFTVDMTRSLSFYISTLRLHAIPLRLSLSNLRSLPNASSLPTLLPSHSLLLTRPSSSSSPDSIFINGVPLLLPGLFYSPNLAVHGLPALLPFASPPPASSRDLKPSILPPFTDAVVPSVGPSGFDVYAPTDSSQDMDPPAIGDVSTLQLAFQVPKKGGEEDKIQQDMEASEF